MLVPLKVQSEQKQDSKRKQSEAVNKIGFSKPFESPQPGECLELHKCAEKILGRWVLVCKISYGQICIGHTDQVHRFAYGK